MRKYITKLFTAVPLFLAVILLLAGCGASETGDTIKEIKNQITVEYQESDVDESVLEDRYYFSLLGEDDQESYKEILSGLMDHNETITTHIIDNDNALELFQDVLLDYPEIFWCDGSASAETHTGINDYTDIMPGYTYSKEEADTLSEEVEKVADEWLADISASDSDYEKILYVYETIINHTDYISDSDENQNILSVFLYQESVCAGYTKATQYLLNKLGIYSAMVIGTSVYGDSHAWNLVRCDGDFYYLDTTWGDPVYLESEGQDDVDVDNISYDYMLCDEEQLLQTHAFSGDVTLPECGTMKDNYYVQNNDYYTSYDYDEILNTLKSDIDQQAFASVIKFDSEDTYNEAHDEIMNTMISEASQYLGNLYYISTVRCRYLDSKELHKIVIYWQY